LVNVYVQNGDGKTQFEQLPIKNGILVYEVPLPKDISIENLNVQFQMIAFNDVQTVSQDVKISSDKKPLKIELVTFRDKLQPNSKEKWTIKLSGEDKEKVTAEVLANMYDKSLDQFAVNTYSWQSLYSKPYWISQYGINESLAQKYYNKRLKYFNNFGVNSTWLDEVTKQCLIINEAFLEALPYSEIKATAKSIAEEKNLLQESDEGAIDAIVAEVLADPASAKSVEDIKAGQEKAIGFLVGQVMKRSQGKANPAMAQRAIRKQIGV
jgi:hypothetical protein